MVSEVRSVDSLTMVATYIALVDVLAPLTIKLQ
jgi:hypothetical protein